MSSSLSSHIAAAFEVDGTTLFFLIVMCGAAVYAIRQKVASVFTLLLVFPIALLASMISYYSFLTLAMFNIKKMSEWIVWTIVSGSVGNMFAIGVAILLAALAERSSPQAKVLHSSLH